MERRAAANPPRPASWRGPARRSSAAVRSREIDGLGPQPVEDALELGREWGFGADEVAVAGRGELEPPGVEEQALEPGRAAPRFGTPARRPRSVDGIACDRMSDRVEMDADLVGPTGHEIQLEEGPIAEPLAHPIARRRRSAVRDDRHPGPVLRIPPD